MEYYVLCLLLSVVNLFYYIQTSGMHASKQRTNMCINKVEKHAKFGNRNRSDQIK